MADGSKIEWTDATWTPVKGCTRVSPGCGGPGKAGGCYAEIMAARFSLPGQWGEGLAEIVTLPDGSKDHRWTGVVRFDEAELLKPLHWKRPRKIFVCSTADLFHEKVEEDWIDQVFAVMALCPQHTFQVLTKRADRMRDYVTRWYRRRFREGPRNNEVMLGIRDAMLLAVPTMDPEELRRNAIPTIRNVWLGVSAEDQQRADERIPDLLWTQAAMRFVSAEPLLGPIDLRFARDWCDLCGGTGILARWPKGPCHVCGGVGRVLINGRPDRRGYRKLDWVIVGGESGPGARPMHPDWARSVRDQCAAAGVPFFFKQWGMFAPLAAALPAIDGPAPAAWPDGTVGQGTAAANGGPGVVLFRGTKEVTGRLLDGVTHDGMPAVAHV